MDKNFDTTLMYYYSFDENPLKKNITILNELIEQHNTVYKLVFEIINNNKRYKINYDNNQSKQLIESPECIISKLYVLKQ